MSCLHAQVLAIAAVAGASGLAFAEGVDLSKVDRSITKEPVWTSGEPQYCLFVISAERRIWFVVDGDDLYMDINENGDLTDPGEKLPRLELSFEQRRETRNYSDWQIPDIKGTDGEPLITEISIYPDINHRAPFERKFVYFNIPVSGRKHMRPTFGDSPADAPILHPTGPHRLSLEVRRYTQADNRNVLKAIRVEAHQCVEGLGPGTSFALETLNLDCRVEFPMADGRTEVKEFRLRNYESGPHQTGGATLPEGVVEDGMVKVTLSKRPEATDSAVDPVVVETPVTQHRAVPAAVDQVPTREPLAMDADETAATLAWHGGRGKMVFSPGRSRRAIATADKIEIRNEESGETVVSVGGHSSRVNVLAFGPDGKRVAAASSDCSIRVWDAMSGEVQLAFVAHVPRLKGYFATVYDVTFSPDGTQMASASADGTAKLWDAVTGEELRTFRRPVRYVNDARSLAFSPNGERLAVAYRDGVVLLWDIVSGEESITMKTKGGIVGSLTFSPDGTRLASAGQRAVVNVWDATSGEHLLRLTGHNKYWVWSLAFSPDGERLGLMVAEPDQPVLVWDVTPAPVDDKAPKNQ